MIDVKIKLKKTLFAFVVTFLAVPMFAATITWTGGISTDWNTSGNWDGASVPSDDVIIPNVSNDPIIANGETHEVNDLTIASGAIVRIGPDSGSSGATLKVNGDVDNEGIIFSNENSSLVLLGAYTTTKTESFANSRTVYGDLSYSAYSVPFSDGSIALFNGVFSYEYNNETGAYDALSFSTATEAGKGYFVSISGGSTSFTLGFGGTPIDEDVNIAITKGTSDDFNLVGNPYTAAISVSDFLANSNNSSNTTGVVYLWDDGGSNSGSDRLGDYITVNSMGAVGTDDLGDGTAGVKGESVFDGYITTMQGFFVEATANGNVSFTQDMQVTGNNADANFYRLAEDPRTKLKLSLVKDGVSTSTLIGFDENATLGVDYSLDAKKLKVEETISIYSVRDEVPYAIQALPLLAGEEVTIPIALDAPTKGTYQLFVSELINLPANHRAHLHDHVTEATYELNVETMIEFTSEVVTNNARFTLSFQPEIVANVEAQLTENLVLLGASLDELTIQYPASSAAVSIYELDGRMVFTEEVALASNQAVLEVALQESTVYILRIADETVKFSIKK